MEDEAGAAALSEFSWGLLEGVSDGVEPAGVVVVDVLPVRDSDEMADGCNKLGEMVSVPVGAVIAAEALVVEGTGPFFPTNLFPL